MNARTIEDLFHAALEKPPAERSAFLRAECGDDVESISAVQSLLNSLETADDFLETPAAEWIGGAAGTGDASTVHGSTVGGYRIVRVIAAGGMGIVYEAEQASPRRPVALKLLRRGFRTTAAVRRFQRESEVLGRLSHIGVAQVFEAGVEEEAGESLPFFAMELLPGALPLTTYANDKGLDTRQRVQLVCAVCEAVEYCHQQGVVHRDLKPANILVTPEGRPKVIDFGVARLHSDLQSDVTWHTTGTPFIGSLPYMSPEQAGLNADAIDAQSDVYALGAIAYELLSGQIALNIASLPPLEGARFIRDEDPPRLGSVDRRFRGDLETIVATAMAKEKVRRYPSAAALATDLGRFLRKEPIRARRARMAYRFRKFASRHRALTGGLTIAFVGLLLGAGAAAWQAVLATTQRDRAGKALAESERVTQFVQSILVQADPKTYGRNWSVRDALDRAALRIDAEFSDSPRVRAGLHETVAMSYWGIGELASAKEHLLQSLESQDVAEIPDQKARHVTAVQLVRLYLFAGDLDAAEGLLTDVEERGAELHEFDPVAASNLLALRAQVARIRRDYEHAAGLFREAREIRRTVPGDQSIAVAEYTMDLAATISRQGLDKDTPVELGREAVSSFRDRLGQQSPTTLWGMRDLSYFLAMRGQPDDLVEAETLLNETVREQIRLSGEQSLEAAIMWSELGAVIDQLGRFEEARTYLDRALNLKRSLLGDDHLEVAQTEFNLAKFLARHGNTTDAIPLLQDSLRIRRSQLAPRHPDVALSLRRLAHVMHAEGEYSGAESLYREAFASSRQLLGDGHQDLAAELADIGATLIRQGRCSEAEALLRDTLTMCRSVTSDRVPPPWVCHDVMGLLGEALVGRADEVVESDVRQAAESFAEAEELLLESYRVMLVDAEPPERAQSVGADHVREALDRIVHLYEVWDAAEPKKSYSTEAAMWRAKRGP